MSTSTIFRSNNPLDHTAVDGVYIDERRPPGPIRGVSNDIVCLVGHFQKGPINKITSISSARELEDVFGLIGPDANGVFYPGIVALRNKRFGRLRVIRVASSAIATAGANLIDDPGAVIILRADASSPGIWGNGLQLVIAAASDGDATHFNLTVKYSGVVVETHKNVNPATTTIGQILPIGSDFIAVTRVAVGRPDNAASVNLTLGADGVPAAGDFSTALDKLRASEAANIRWVIAATHGMGDTLLGNVNALVRDLAVETSTKIGVIHGPLTQTKAQAITDVALYRTDRMIYVYPAVDTFIPEVNGGAGDVMRVGLHSFMASVCAALPPGTDPATVDSEEFLTGIRAMADDTLERSDYIDLLEAGICSLVFGERQAFRFRSGVTTSLDPSLTQIERRTIADYIQESVALALVSYQNQPLSFVNRLLMKSAVASFLQRIANAGLLPGPQDTEDQDLAPFLVDIDSGNTAATLALGEFVIIIRVRIFSAARFIVLRTEIGEGVEIKISEVQ